MKEIIFQNAHHQKHFEFFNSMQNPHFSICANVDITTLLEVKQRFKISSHLAIVYLISKTANSIPEFKQRIRNGKVVEHEIIHPSFTVETEVSDVFSFCYVEYREEVNRFLSSAKTNMEQMKSQPSIEDEVGRDDFLFLSAIPWITFTGIQHAMHTSPDSVPRFTWGKFFEKDGQTMMPFSIQAHHALVNGKQMGEFFDQLQDNLNDVGSLFQNY